MKLKSCLCIAFCLVIAAVGSGCGSKSGNGSNGSSKDRIDLRIYLSNGADWEGGASDRVMQKIEEETNTNLKFEGPSSDYYEALNPMLNTGDFPDIFFSVPSNTSGAYDKWASQDENGILVNMDLLLAQHPGEFPYLEKLFQSEQYKNIKWDDAHTLVPWMTSDYVYGIYYRKDWLIKVGEVNTDGTAKTPVTLEDFERVLQKFTENDPDGNGKNDTYGMSPNSEPFCWNQLYHAFGVCEDWDMDDSGNIQYMYTQENFKKFLKWANKLYKNGWIDPGFNTNINTRDRDLWQDGKVGVLMTDVEQHVKWVMSSFEKKQGADLVIMGSPLLGTKKVGIDGCGGSSSRGGWYGGFSITKACKNPEAALRYLNYIVSPEGSKLNRYGIEGVHYTVDSNGTYVANVSEREEEPSGRFETSTDDAGKTVPNGSYRIGSNEQGGAIDWSTFDTDGKIVINADASILDYHFKDLIKQAQDKYIKYEDKIPSNIVFPSVISAKEMKIKDIAITFINSAIMGKKNLTSDWDNMISECEKNDMSSVKKVIKDFVNSES